MSEYDTIMEYSKEASRKPQNQRSWNHKQIESKIDNLESCQKNGFKIYNFLKCCQTIRKSIVLEILENGPIPDISKIAAKWYRNTAFYKTRPGHPKIQRFMKTWKI